MRLVAGAAWLVTVAVAGSLAAQGLGEAAAKEKKRREAQKQAEAKEDKAKAKTFTDEDLQKYAGATPNGGQAAGPAAEDGGATTGGKASAPPAVSKGPGEEVKRIQAAAIKADLQRCQVDLTAARAAYKTAEVEEPSVEYPAGYPVSPSEARDRVREMKAANLKAARSRVEQAERNCAALEDAARRADIPPGWIR